MSEPSDIGSITIRRHNHPNDESWDVEITQASQRVLISGELLREARAGGTMTRYLTADDTTVTLADDFGQRFTYRLRPDVSTGDGGDWCLMEREDAR